MNDSIYFTNIISFVSGNAKERDDVSGRRGGTSTIVSLHGSEEEDEDMGHMDNYNKDDTLNHIAKANDDYTRNQYVTDITNGLHYKL